MFADRRARVKGHAPRIVPIEEDIEVLEEMMPDLIEEEGLTDYLRYIGQLREEGTLTAKEAGRLKTEARRYVAECRKRPA